MRGKAQTLLSVTVALPLFCGCLSALEPTHKLTQYAHSSWTRQGGQLTGAVFALAQTKDGILWVGTDYGLMQFDGIRFVPWTPPSGQQLTNGFISALAAASDGALWIGTPQGLSRLQGATVKNYPTRTGPAGPGVTAILEDHSQTVWFGTAGYRTGGLCRVDANSSHCSSAEGLPEPSVYSLLEDHAGHLWVGGLGSLSQRTSGSLQTYRLSEPVMVSSIAEGRHGQIWAATARRGALEQFENGELHTYRFPVSDQTKQPRDVLFDRDGGLWIGTWGQGLVHLYQGQLDRFTQTDGLSSDTIVKLFEDREGNIWVATDGGLDRFRDFAVTTISKRDGLSENTVASVFASRRGGIWIGSMRGLNYLQDGKTTVYDKHRGLPSDSITSIFEEDSGRLWADTNAGLAYAEKDRFFALDIPIARKMTVITAAVEDRDHSIWFSDPSQGLVHIRDTHLADVVPWSLFNNKTGGPMEADAKRAGLWLGFSKGGIALYKPGQSTRWYTIADGLGAGAVRDLHLDGNGTLWIATEAGLSRLTEGHIATLTAAQGLPCDRIHAMVTDQSGALWLNTACGLVRLAASDLARWSANPRSKIEARVFDASDGMRARPLPTGYFRRAARSSDGRLWFPMFDGIAVVDPKNLRENRLAPPVQVENISGDGTMLGLNSELRFPPLTKEVQIDYTALSFVAPEKVRFRYQLEGFDTQWIEAGARRQAIFTNLSPKQYRFRVIACNNDGIWNETGASLSFSIKPAVYQTNWFRLLCLAAFSALLWSLYLVRVRRIAAQLSMRYEERLNERSRIARDLHDTLLQNISGFALQLDALAKKVAAPLSAKESLSDLRREAEQWLREARESVWNLRPSLESRDLLAALREDGEQIIRGKGIQLDVSVTGMRRRAPAALELQLLRVVQEAIRNAVRHGQAKKISVLVAYIDPNVIRIRIEDDGCGFVLDEASRKTGHLGLSSMRERAQQIGAEFKINTAPGRGSLIEIVAPITSEPQ